MENYDCCILLCAAILEAVAGGKAYKEAIVVILYSRVKCLWQMLTSDARLLPKALVINQNIMIKKYATFPASVRPADHLSGRLKKAANTAFFPITVQ